MTPDSASAAPSVESLRQQFKDVEKRLLVSLSDRWTAHGDRGSNEYNHCEDKSEECAWCSDSQREIKELSALIDALQPFLDHERSLVAEIQRLTDQLETQKAAYDM